MVVLLFPIVLLEELWYRSFLCLPWQRALMGSWSANIWSTFIGLPIAWALWLVVEFVTVGITGTDVASYRNLYDSPYPIKFLYFVATSAWLFDFGYAGLAIHGAALVLLLPAYLISDLSEAKLLQKKWWELEPRRVYRHVWLAHLRPYSLLYGIAIYRYWQIARSWPLWKEYF